MKITAKTLMALSFTLAFAATTTFAQYAITLDENGHGTFQIATNPLPLLGSLALDPVSGKTTLCYDLTALQQQLQFTFTPGDVLIYSSSEPSGTSYSDLVRFEQNNPAHPGAFIYFFSDLEPGVPNPDLADVGLPQVIGTNAFAMEIGPEGNNQAAYQPFGGAGFQPQPGFIPQVPGSAYTFISDVPEPGSLPLFASAVGGLLVFRARRRTRVRLRLCYGTR
ncbi:MAG TPA: PEP-CTERM sorting domain-containing protein [Candidatus Dormibacteraeota bacterium]|nr:PEP-CTERM sorting domain-containing protein [Candidatus Dormibacteraeota bacterium]